MVKITIDLPEIFTWVKTHKSGLQCKVEYKTKDIPVLMHRAIWDNGLTQKTGDSTAMAATNLALEKYAATLDATKPLPRGVATQAATEFPQEYMDAALIMAEECRDNILAGVWKERKATSGGDPDIGVKIAIARDAAPKGKMTVKDAMVFIAIEANAWMFTPELITAKRDDMQAIAAFELAQKTKALARLAAASDVAKAVADVMMVEVEIALASDFTPEPEQTK